jgi:Tfp pilus assembly protein PilV
MNRKRQGAMLLEALVATALLGTALTISAQLSGLARAQHRNTERRAVAIAEVANLMERAAALPVDQITPEQVATWKLSAAATSSLPEARLAAEVRDEAGEFPARRLSIEIRWCHRAGQDESPVRLSTWLYPPPPEPAADVAPNAAPAAEQEATP